MRRLLSVLAVAALFLAACGDDDDGDAVTTTTTVDEDRSDTDGDGGDSGDDDGPTTTVETTTSTTAPGGGGDEGPEDPAAVVLEAAGLLRDGRATIGMTAPEDPAVHRALCRFVFGEPAEVGEIAAQSGESELADGSGYEDLGGNGGGLQCLYVFDGLELLGLALWEEELEEGVETLLQVPVEGGQYGIVAYNPDYDGARMDVETANALLDDASTRWNPSGV